MAIGKFGKKKGETPPVIKKIEMISGGAAEDESNWLVSYADMMTLLCGFFIMMFSMARLDDPKYDSFKAAVAKQFGGEYTSPTKELAKFATNIIQELGLSQEAIVKSDPWGVSVTFESTVLFGTLSADLTEPGRKLLSQLLDAFAKREEDTKKKYRIVVEGHTDGRPVVSGSFPSNWELSGARASRVIRLFLEKGYQPNRLTSIGYADTRPQNVERRKDGSWDEEALKKNRRVVVQLLEPQVDYIPIPADQPAATEARMPASVGAPATGDAQPAVAAPAPVTAPAATTTAPAAVPAATQPTQPASSSTHHRG